MTDELVAETQTARDAAVSLDQALTNRQIGQAIMDRVNPPSSDAGTSSTRRSGPSMKSVMTRFGTLLAEAAQRQNNPVTEEQARQEFLRVMSMLGTSASGITGGDRDDPQQGSN
jgi:hypothetical protein